MKVRVGDRVEYVRNGQTQQGTVETILYIGSMKARVVNDEGTQTTLSTRELRVIKEAK